MSLSDGRFEGASARARSMEAPADDDSPASPAVPAAPRASPPFNSVRRLTPLVVCAPFFWRAASSRGVSAPMQPPPRAVDVVTTAPSVPDFPVRCQGNGGGG